MRRVAEWRHDGVEGPLVRPASIPREQRTDPAAASAAIDDIAVPLQQLALGTVACGVRQQDGLTVECVVGAPVFVFVAQALADGERRVGAHGHEPKVEEPMQVFAQRQPVRDGVPTSITVRLDVRGIEHR